ncbi:MAG: chemotaxis protein CheD [Candidatus Margulisiibacteriota bacterium]
MVCISVGLAEVKFSKTSGDVIMAHGLGSCVGVAIYDKIMHLGGMIHIVLPSHEIQRDGASPERFADLGVPILLDKFVLFGGNLLQAVIKIAGGSNMFKQESASVLNIGARNAVAVLEALKKRNIVPQAQDVGGTNGRTFSLHIDTGRITSRMIGMQEKEL